MYLKYKYVIPLFLFLLWSEIGFTQNFDKLGNEDQIKVSGAINFNTILYGSSGVTIPSREPFTWYASGRLNVSILDVSLPFTYTYSNQGGKYTQPFNRSALHPSYKWAKGHFGLTSMNFSPYTFSGHLFLGGGIELTPNNWKIAFFGGRLIKEIMYDPITDNKDDFAYRRYGYGINVEYKEKGFLLGMTMFKGYDDLHSIEIVPLNAKIHPQDNFVLSLIGNAQFSKRLQLQTEYAISALTNNMNDPISELSIAQKNVLNNFILANSTTNQYEAYKASLKYALKFATFSINYEHVDPGYKTLGGYYFNSDLENYTLSPSFTLLKKKLNISLNTGFQRNNLSSTESATTSRWIGNMNVSAVLPSDILLNGTYSNFSTYTKNRPSTDPFYFTYADTMNFFQVTQNSSVIFSWNFGKKDKVNAVQAIYNYQLSNSLSGSITNPGYLGINEIGNSSQPTIVHAANFAYSRKIPWLNAAISGALNFNQSEIPVTKSLFIGPSLNFQKSLFDKKSNLSIGSTYNQQLQNGNQISNILNHHLSFSYSPKGKEKKMGKLNLTVNGNYLTKLSVESGIKNKHELNIFLNIGYTF